jgi:hypothetical protein
LFPPTGKIPFVGETGALLRFNSLDATSVASFQENAGTVGFFDQSQADPVAPQNGVLVDEFRHGNPEMIGDAIHFCVGNRDLAPPSAAVSAALTDEAVAFDHIVKNHTGKIADQGDLSPL